MHGISRKRVVLATLVVIGAAMSGCSKKDNYAADTAAAVDTAAMTASSTAPAVQDTATAAPTTPPAKTSTAKKAPKKSTY